MNRPSWDDYFMQMAEMASTRATCPRANVGAIIVSNKKILSTGYNGSPAGMQHCIDVGCIMVNDHCKRCIHAEANAILQAKQDLKNSTIYCTHSPCLECTKLIIGSKIIKIVYKKEYRDEVSSKLLSEAGFVKGQNAYIRPAFSLDFTG